MQKVLLLLTIAISLNCSCQSWCPPGATWTYEAGMFLAGYNRMSYAGDTLIDGYSSQIIDRTSAIQYPQPPPGGWSQPYHEYTPVAVITRLEDDVVYIRGGNEWDTLYWFGALPGNSWSMAHVNDTSCARFIVTAIGTDTIDGIPLRWLDFESSPRLYERIGSVWDMFMYCPNWIIDGPMGIRCYSDDQINATFSVSSDQYGCDWLMTVPQVDPTQIALYPNPGNDHFILSGVEGQLPAGHHSLFIFDQLGRSVIEMDRISDQDVIGTASLPPGIYTVLITDRNGRMFHQRWIKE